MNLSRYDHLLEQRNVRRDLPTPEAKCRQELAELLLALCHLEEGRYAADAQVVEECAHVLLAVRGLILARGIEPGVLIELELKARGLHEVILRQYAVDILLGVQWGPM